MCARSCSCICTAEGLPYELTRSILLDYCIHWNYLQYPSLVRHVLWLRVVCTEWKAIIDACHRFWAFMLPPSEPLFRCHLISPSIIVQTLRQKGIARRKAELAKLAVSRERTEQRLARLDGDMSRLQSALELLEAPMRKRRK